MKKQIFAIIFILCFSLYAQDELVIFSDSPEGDTYYDASWGFANSPSTLELKGADNTKFPVEAAYSFQGSHSLRLKWKSSSGGDWGIAFAKQGWPGINFNGFDSLVYWINAPSEVQQSALPDLLIEDLSNQKSGKVWLGSYLNTVDSSTETWQKVSIPISDFPTGSADFSNIKTVFHVQKNNNETEHIVWIDEVKILKKGVSGVSPFDPPLITHLDAHDSRTDIKWQESQSFIAYNVYRSSNKDDAFSKINSSSYTYNIYSDFTGINDQEFFYYITGIDQNSMETLPSDTLSATPFSMTNDELLTSVQEATFRYFYDYGHPVSGLARERKGSGNTCTSGGSGFGLMAMAVGVERGFVPRDSAATRVLKILSFMKNKAVRYHGAWAHWINGQTGQTIPFSQYDNGADLVETAFFIQGVLTVRQYFDQNNAIEDEIRAISNELWEDVEWDWFRKDPAENVLYWHWSPNYGWQLNHSIRGFNETMIVYLLAIASPTHPVPKELYDLGWAGQNYTNGKTFYGHKQWVGPDKGGPLFFTHYSFLGFDPRDKADKYCNYFQNNKNTSLINRSYCFVNSGGHTGYSFLEWGLTASDNPWGYNAHSPTNDNGTITPTAALSAMPYIPDESLATLRHFYFEYGDRLWAEFGFKDAFNRDQDWFADSYLAIDQGPIILMIENARTGLLWNTFMSSPEIAPMLDSLNWVVTNLESEKGKSVSNFELKQNFPNPFNPVTQIEYQLASAGFVSLELFDGLGKKVSNPVNTFQIAGKYKVTINAENFASGVYYYRLKVSGHNPGLIYQKTEKMILIR
ncbi:MAG: T9SS C-terminal target domain-containing protein [Calditrichaeota bacterium]|nr:T9SS C-terminal target domain-containing protein [Calditrichota bacterium]NOG44095.1 T9SS type A sorting domain-containing protein [Calditrichota bacterium]